MSTADFEREFAIQAPSEPVRTHEAYRDYRIAAIVPCYNEEATVANVVRDLRTSVPGITVYVYDNNSTDRTARKARMAGAIVRTELTKGKGNVVRRAFADIDADIYLLIDGDDTYDAAMAPRLIDALIDGPYDHVLGVRNPDPADGPAYRPNHEFGNRMLNAINARIFGRNVGDMLSGFRVFSRRFVKSFPAVSREFEIETELTVHCLALRVPSTEVEVGFRDRPEGSESKLRTYRDGFRILNLIVNLARHERPIAFYGTIAALLVLLGIGAATPSVLDYLTTGLVPRMPSFLVAVSLVLTAVVLMVAGLVLDGIRQSRHANSRLQYLTLPSVRPGVPARSVAYQHTTSAANEIEIAHAAPELA